MAILISILKFIFAFIGLSSSLLLVSLIISSIINPQIELDKDGHAVDKNRNARLWLGLITSFFWALLIAI